MDNGVSENPAVFVCFLNINSWKYVTFPLLMKKEIIQKLFRNFYIFVQHSQRQEKNFRIISDKFLSFFK